MMEPHPLTTLNRERAPVTNIRSTLSSAKAPARKRIGYYNVIYRLNPEKHPARFARPPSTRARVRELARSARSLRSLAVNVSHERTALPRVQILLAR